MDLQETVTLKDKESESLRWTYKRSASPSEPHICWGQVK